METSPENETDSQAWRYGAVKVLGELAHSLRNPFATVQSYLNILEMEDYIFDPEELKEVSFALKETVDKALKMIDEKIVELKNSISNP